MTELGRVAKHLFDRLCFAVGGLLPVDAEDRTADMPIDKQYRFAVGADHKRDNGSVISYSLEYADYGDAEIDSSELLPAIGFTGEYGTNEIWFFSVSYNMAYGSGRR